MQKIRNLSCPVFGEVGSMHSLHFGNGSSSVAFVKEWPPVSAVLLGWMSLCEPLCSGLLVLNLLFSCSETCSYQQKDGLWEYGGLVMQSHPSFYFRKDNMYWKFLSRQPLTVWFFIFCSSDEHLGLTSSTKPGAGYPCSPFSVNLVIVLSLS